VAQPFVRQIEDSVAAGRRELSLDDRVARYLPDVPHGGQVTIPQLLNHTAGYDDYWSQTYLPHYLLKRPEPTRAP
jgi:CubicO group peptidase (beta-lactamase class C family)